MGKMTPSVRSLVSTSLIRKPPSLSPNQSPSHKPHNSQTHLTRKTPPQNSGKTQLQTRTKNPFTSPNLSDAKRVFNSIATATKTPLDLRVHNALLQSYAAISTVNDSIALFNHMIKTQPAFSPDRSTYHILLAQSCTVPDQTLQSVHQVLNFMLNNGFHPDKVTTDIAVRSLCLAGHVDEAVQVMKQMSLKNAVPDTYTYNFLVKCLCKSRVLSTVKEFIDDMRKSFDLKPDLVTYTIMIDNVANSKNLREASRLVKELDKEGFKPDCYVYNTIMKGYCMLSKGNEVVQVLKDMQENGVEPDLVTYNTLIFGLSKCGRVMEAKNYLRIMVDMGHFPNEVTYTSLMNGLCRKGDALGAVALLEEMQAQGCSPNECTYNTLLHGLCKGRLLEKGLELYGLMKKDGMKLDTASYSTLVRTLCRAGRVADAYGVFDYAVESKSLTNVSAYLTLESTVKQLKKARP
ncbi:pentatricopeptide repeat-containing protein At2g17670 [Rosa chinensis]|uniref:pentatricopeptide repeat-containing protein At2g17670 n=1 Tax=Rosa chinensis TaxID=74649 RepID=UPI001AD90485|nr:pentatricopeptide repeat-containing protein At2g17670 [Rosa chinensis]